MHISSPASVSNTAPCLVVDDDETQLADFIATVAESKGFRVKTVHSAKEFMALYPDTRIGGIFLDIIMPDMDGIELIRWLGERHCSAPITIMTGYDLTYAQMLTMIADSLGIAVLGKLTKPIDLAVLEQSLDAFQEAWA